MALLWPYVTLAATNRWISVDQGWIRAGHIQGDVLGPFSRSGMAIVGRHRAPKWLKIAINDPFVAILHPGGSKLVDQCGSRLDQGGAHPGRWFGTIYSSRNCHLGALQRSKVAQIGHKWGIFGKKRPWRNSSPRSPFCNAVNTKTLSL